MTLIQADAGESVIWIDNRDGSNSNTRGAKSPGVAKNKFGNWLLSRSAW